MWWWLLACRDEETGHGVQSGDPVACLDAPGDAALPVTVTGLATADGDPDGAETWDAGARCDAVTRRFELTDDQDRPWRVGYGWTENGVPATEALDILPETPLALTFWAEDDHAGFVLTQLDRLVAATAVGIGNPGLPDDAVVGLTVRNGPTTGTEATDCGTRVSRKIRFEGQDELDLEPVDADWMTVDGQLVRAWALAAWGMRNATCDQDGELSWAVWRGGDR